jgi:hypothetical protein
VKCNIIAAAFGEVVTRLVPAVPPPAFRHDPWILLVRTVTSMCVSTVAKSQITNFSSFFFPQDDAVVVIIASSGFSFSIE